ncbi:hypothetical protein B0H17DRAFT_1049038 [Mycena rosella]|uniref:Secreted protein n=1 Tax=Mycena rosella TaxID=1033263 RepID=A0AAD7DV11_MYCRO|nr:hypothetical protein B0H17DRAFT_1049038 [Mycena rosella]
MRVRRVVLLLALTLARLINPFSTATEKREERRTTTSHSDTGGKPHTALCADTTAQCSRGHQDHRTLLRQTQRCIPAQAESSVSMRPRRIPRGVARRAPSAHSAPGAEAAVRPPSPARACVRAAAGGRLHGERCGGSESVPHLLWTRERPGHFVRGTGKP